MPGVFISCACADQEFARHLYDAPLAAGREPTWDQDHGAVPFSVPWRPEIQATIENSDKSVLVGAGDSQPHGSVLIRTASGHVLTSLRSPAQIGPTPDPGVVICLHGHYVLGDIEGFAAISDQADSDAIYGPTSSQELKDLQTRWAKLLPSTRGCLT